MGTYTPLVFPSRRAQENIYEYRKRVADILGFDKDAADLLAAAKDINLADAAILLERGCPHALAIRILL